MEITPPGSMDSAHHRDRADAYLLGDLTGADREAFEHHLFECEICAETVKTGQRLVEGARGRTRPRTIEVLAPESSQPSSPRAVPGRRRFVSSGLALALSAGLAGFVLYQQAVVVPDLRRQVAEGRAPLVVTPRLLHPATRGNGQTLSVPGGGGSLFVELDLPPLPEGRGLQICVQTNEGLPRGDCLSAKAPGEGLPLMVKLDGTMVGGGPHVILLFQIETNGPRELARYAFTTAGP